MGGRIIHRSAWKGYSRKFMVAISARVAPFRGDSTDPMELFISIPLLFAAFVARISPPPGTRVRGEFVEARSRRPNFRRIGVSTNATANALYLKREVLEIFLLLEFLHSLLATCGLLLGCQTPPSRTCGFGSNLINGCGSFCLLLRITAAA